MECSIKEEACILGLDNDTYRIRKPSDVKKTGNHQKLKLALQKRQIINEEIAKLQSLLKTLQKGTKSGRSRHRRLFISLDYDPFIKFYLKIYRELCGVRNIGEITNEVYKRWNAKKRKPKMNQWSKGGIASLNIRTRSFVKPNNAEEDHKKVVMAIMKNKIVSEEISKLTGFIKRLKKQKKVYGPFLQIYLKVFREMCGKCNSEEIKTEAIKRWQMMENESSGEMPKRSKLMDKSLAKKSQKKKKKLLRQSIGKLKAIDQKKSDQCRHHSQLSPCMVRGIQPSLLPQSPKNK